MVKVAALQFDISWENPPENFAKVLSWLEKAANSGAQLVVLPEMFATGFSMNTEEVLRDEKRIRDFLSKQAARLGVTLVGGLASQAQEQGFNCAAAFSPSGKLLTEYQKIHLFTLGKENQSYLPGSTLKNFEVAGLKVTPFICYDLRFPEVFRACACTTDLFVVIANWPASRSLAWSTLLRARAIENQAYVLGVNRVGTGDGLQYSGHSEIFGPLGESLANLAEGAEGLITADLDSGLIQDVRSKFPFLKDRKTRLYQELYSSSEPD